MSWHKTILMQTTSHLLMIRPARFGNNRQSPVNNSFQTPAAEGSEWIREAAADEFDRLVDTLRQHDIDVLVVDDTPEPHTPDSIFPNNWFSFHQDGTVVR